MASPTAFALHIGVPSAIKSALQSVTGQTVVGNRVQGLRTQFIGRQAYVELQVLQTGANYDPSRPSFMLNAIDPADPAPAVADRPAPPASRGHIPPGERRGGRGRGRGRGREGGEDRELGAGDGGEGRRGGRGGRRGRGRGRGHDREGAQ